MKSLISYIHIKYFTHTVKLQSSNIIRSDALSKVIGIKNTIKEYIVASKGNKGTFNKKNLSSINTTNDKIYKKGNATEVLACLNIYSVRNSKPNIADQESNSLNMSSGESVSPNTKDNSEGIYLDISRGQSTTSKIKDNSKYIQADPEDFNHHYINEKPKKNKLNGINNDVVENGYMCVDESSDDVVDGRQDDITDVKLDNYSLKFDNEVKSERKYAEKEQACDDFIELPNKTKIKINDILKEKEIFNKEDLLKKKENFIDYISGVIARSDKFKLVKLSREDNDKQTNYILKEKIKEEISKEMENISLCDRLVINKEEFGYVFVEKIIRFLSKYENKSNSIKNKDKYIKNESDYKKRLEHLYKFYGLNNLNKKIDNMINLQYLKYEQGKYEDGIAEKNKEISLVDNLTENEKNENIERQKEIQIKMQEEIQSKRARDMFLSTPRLDKQAEDNLEAQHKVALASIDQSAKDLLDDIDKQLIIAKKLRNN